jgi:beta-glucosidase/6-phospho-beta-glucosidase/beta-galactosidase
MEETWVKPSPGPAKGVAVTEFGFSEPFESSKVLLQDILYDTVRASYYHDYMEAILLAIAEGTDVIGSLAWSFVDNYVST